MGTSQSKAKDLIWKILSGVSVFGFAFAVSYLSSSHFAPVSESEAASSTYYASISSSESIDITLQSTPDGVYKVGKDSLSIDTNSTIGYKLYISTIDHSSDNNNGTSLPSGTPANGLIDSATGAYISPSSGTVDTPVRLATNTWGYTVSRSSSSETSTSYVDSDAAPTETKGGKAVWRAVPVYGNEDLFYTNTDPSNSSSTTGDTNTVDVYYAANASTALPSGTYSNTVVYTAITEGNAPSSSSNLVITPSSQAGLITSTKVTISTGFYTGFSADNLGNITTTIGGKACASPTYSVSSTNGNLVISCTAPTQTSIDTIGSYDVSVTVTKNGETLYNEALVNGYTYTTPAGGTMQNFVCSSLANVGDSVELLDSRDNKTYLVKKLSDSRCWMVQNLRLVGPRTLTSADSNIASGSFNLTASDGGAWCTDVYSSACVNASRIYDSGNVKYGVYYDWYAATAGSGRYEMDSGTFTSDSVCPKSWILPSVDNYKTLDVAFGGTGVNRDNANTYSYFTGVAYGDFTLAGVKYGSTIVLEGVVSWYLTSYSNTYPNAKSLFLDARTNNVSPQAGSDKMNGASVRCIAQ